MGQNPAEGAAIDYTLTQDAQGPVTVEIVDSLGKVVRKYSSDDAPELIREDALPYPSYWFRPARKVASTAGMHRWMWDLRHTAPEGFAKSFPISAIYRDTPPHPCAER